ncbi:MAG TPA: amidase [Ktedonobacterales bacterium]|jgi:aspartyl-tRNA(Asn)/glutamyl-tRNA(Gln) amidotransferase subunit A
MTHADASATPYRAPTLAEAARQLRAGEVTSVALTEACLRRIEQVDGVLKACVTMMADAALEQARAADAALAAKRIKSPLHGLPLAIKDLFATRGVRTTAGSGVLADWIPDEDATAVTKLAEAGAIALCKTNTHEFAYGTLTPPTRNPWDTTRAPGGSSGGTAAAVASGESLGGLGTDTGGSIRIPAGFCGVTGLKPTYGLVGRGGVVPLSGSYDHAGPIAWTVEDCALLLDAIAGYDPRDPDSADVPLLDFTAALGDRLTPEDAARGTRIGIPDRFFYDLIDDDVAAALEATRATFERLGAVLVEVAMPDGVDDLLSVYRAVQRPEAYTYHTDMGWLAERTDKYFPETLANLKLGADYSAADYIRAQQRRRVFTDAMRAVLRQVDVLLTPTLAIPAPLADEYGSAFVVRGQALEGGSLRFTLPFNLTGEPALSIPCGFSASGLPIGAQLVAAHFNEPTLLRLGHAYQRATDWHTHRPTL